MIQYRFLTPRRRGKWYGSLTEAQYHANAIGAGFLDSAGTFVPYRGTVLELRHVGTGSPVQGAISTPSHP
ncbi:hypothetical protein EYB45_06340 [Erythrobacteraceae bacterium CFH 75059]|uniref:hypothetical protein n=1 Tax=Qipengyuania thermophila TaxID=2509361 RepID=UPI00102215B5|nr:hypothetical protein [Qipengyuania thermophila]TCD05119.1 hypothetical protein EYB45_06340 [Erythrobacteraceae bacterium CFH 75059]